MKREGHPAQERFADQGIPAFYGELRKRTAKLAADAGTGNLQKTSLACGRVLEDCASCHAKFRD